MATSLLALLDDIASTLDDIALLTKVAAKKSAGVLGDDLALNAQQVSGVDATRELPVVWAVAKGSAVNKLILVPVALVISALAPWLVTPLLMLGGAFLCFEGSEKLAHKLLHSPEEEAHERERLRAALVSPEVDLLELEKTKVKGAIRTDFVLSAEIVAITLGSVAEADFGTRLGVLTGISAIMTAGVYGLVAGIVKLDDLGLHLSRRTGETGLAAMQRSIGEGVLIAAPYLMKTLSVAGTAAMFLVGGGILTHGIPPIHHALEQLAGAAGEVSGLGGVLAVVLPALLNGIFGLLAGALIVGVVMLIRRMRKSAH